jgi:anti-sigma factor ChrR (cupin superfamily)
MQKKSRSNPPLEGLQARTSSASNATGERIRADLTQRAVVLAGTVPWLPSPTAGVDRVRLDRFGENGRATSIVRFAPNAGFPRHTHAGGEEIFVLDGLFIDHAGRYPAGTYLRNPIGSEHAPYAGPEGATIFVKLHQSSPEDVTRVVIDTTSAAWKAGSVRGLTVLPLHEFHTEQVALVRWAPDTHFPHHAHWGGEEVLVLEGVFRDEHGSYPRGSWTRSPHLSTHTPFTELEGATILVKTGHLGGVLR